MASAKNLWNTVKGFGTAVRANSKASNYINRAVTWGAIGGAVGGASEWAQGGSFFEGAKSGAFTGAVAGAGYTAYKAGTRRPGSYTLNRGFKGTFRRPTGAAGGSAPSGAVAAAEAHAQAKQAQWADLDRRAVKVSAMRRNGTVATAPSSGWSASADMGRLGLPTRAQMARGGVSKQVEALNKLYGDVAFTRRANGLG